MDFQKKREGGPLHNCLPYLLSNFSTFFRTAVGVVVVYERRHFFHYFSPTYLLLCQSQGHSTLFLQYFDASSLSHGANKRKAALNAHISYQFFFVDPKKGYGIKDFGYQVFIAFFLVQKGLKANFLYVLEL